MSSSPSIAAGARAAAGSLVRVPAWLVLLAWVWKLAAEALSSIAAGGAAGGAVTVSPRIAPISSTWRVTLPCSRL